MAKAFPLYDGLLNLADKSQEISIDMGRVCATINKLPSEHCEQIYALIYHHEMKSNGFKYKQLPYKSATFNGGKGILFTMSNLPIILRKIISIYVDKVTSE